MEDNLRKLADLDEQLLARLQEVEELEERAAAAEAEKDDVNRQLVTVGRAKGPGILPRLKKPGLGFVQTPLRAVGPHCRRVEDTP